MVLLSVDPGKHGAIAWSDPDNPVGWVPMPVAGGEIDGATVARIVRDIAPDIAVVEAVHAMPKQGVSSSFTFGKGYGVVLGVLAACGVRTELVTPQAWKREVLAGTAKDKDAAIAYCRRVYPDVSLIPAGHRVPHDGAADALCLCMYAARTYRPRA